MRRTPLRSKRPTPRRDEGRVTHIRVKPYSVQPSQAQKIFHGTLRREHPGGPPNLCQCGCGREGEQIHHILADAPFKSGRRDHWIVVFLNGGCHNGRSDSVHGLGSETAFLRTHGVDLIAVAVANRERWINRA